MSGADQPLLAPGAAASLGEEGMGTAGDPHHGLSSLELAFVAGPFAAAAQDVHGLASLRRKFGRELDKLFDAVDTDGNGSLSRSEVRLLAEAVGCDAGEASAAVRRVFHDLHLDGAGGGMSREVWYVFCLALLGVGDVAGEVKSSLHSTTPTPISCARNARKLCWEERVDGEGEH